MSAPESEVVKAPLRTWGFCPIGYWCKNGLYMPWSHLIGWTIIAYMQFGMHPTLKAVNQALASHLCSKYHFDGVETQGGQLMCTVSFPTTDGMVHAWDVPVPLAQDYELEAFNAQEAKCKPPVPPVVDWEALHKEQLRKIKAGEELELEL